MNNFGNNGPVANAGIILGNVNIQAIYNEEQVNPVGNKLQVVPRSTWNAQPPKAALVDIGLPSVRVIIAHTVTENYDNDTSLASCVKRIQNQHMTERGFSDISYNFLVGCNGTVFEGRGWDKKGDHTDTYNERSICIAFIGTFINIPPPQRQLVAAQMLIDYCVRMEKLKPDYRLYGQRQLKATESPVSSITKASKYDACQTSFHACALKCNALTATDEINSVVKLKNIAEIIRDQP